jgi:hypothetical protein
VNFTLRKKTPRQCLWRSGGQPDGERCREMFYPIATPTQACCVYCGIRWKGLNLKQRHELRAAALKDDAEAAA